MHQVKHTSNPNGKLFNHIFCDIRLYDPSKFFVGNRLQHILGSREIGYTKVLSVKPFKFSQLTDSFSYLNCGHFAAYQAKLLIKYYGKQNELSQDTSFMFIIFEYTQRDLSEQKYFLQEWWRTLLEQSEYSNTSGDLLGD